MIEALIIGLFVGTVALFLITMGSIAGWIDAKKYYRENKDELYE